jgi:hypothetical protein
MKVHLLRLLGLAVRPVPIAHPVRRPPRPVRAPGATRFQHHAELARDRPRVRGPAVGQLLAHAGIGTRPGERGTNLRDELVTRGTAAAAPMADDCTQPTFLQRSRGPVRRLRVRAHILRPRVSAEVSAGAAPQVDERQMTQVARLGAGQQPG